MKIHVLSISQRLRFLLFIQRRIICLTLDSETVITRPEGKGSGIHTSWPHGPLSSGYWGIGAARWYSE